jgi:probable phosphoglycerate mutase
MSELVLIRHAETGWNRAGRIQGQTDAPLSPAGRAMAARWRLPADLTRHRWLTSTLRRTRETAAILGRPDAVALAALNEMHWGAWEGETLRALRGRLGDAMAANEDRGLDFRPDGGESPREVQARLKPLLARLAAEARPTVAVTHNGVIRALYCLASGWDMLGKPPVDFDRESVQRFRIEPDGHLTVFRLNEGMMP